MKKQTKIARIFEDVGGYYICDDSGCRLDCRGPSYPTKAAAMRAAALEQDCDADGNITRAYTHATGSGTYRDGLTSLARYRLEDVQS